MGPKIARYMTPAPHTIGSNQPLSVAHEMMRKHDVRHLPVLAGNELVGVLSQRDLYFIETLKGVDQNEVTVEEAMTQAPFVIDGGASLARVVREMAKHRYGCAVVAEGGQVVGLFTTTDALVVLDEMLRSEELSVAHADATPTEHRRSHR